MLGIKTFIKKNITSLNFLLFKTGADVFPIRATFFLNIKARIFFLETELKEHRKFIGMGNLLTYPHKQAVKVWQKLLPYNPNNLGNWSITDQSVDQLFGTRIFEREVIYKMINLYNGNNKELEGYITSGGTESNIFSAWLGVKYLEKKKLDRKEICLVNTSLTHYSISKAADIIGVPVFTTAINEKKWGMDIDFLRETIKELSKKGYKGFLLPLTVGYTITGTADPYKEICLIIRKLKKKFKIHVYIWLDAALNGLVEPFINKRFEPFSNKEIQSLVVDFHKFGFIPYSAGLTLYKKDLRKYIERPIPYLREKDNTILGSRNGIVATACWTVIHFLGKKGFKKIINNCLQNKEFFIKMLNKSFSNVKIINNPKSISLGLIFSFPKNRRLPKIIENKYGFYPAKLKIKFSKKKEEVIIYKFFFLPGFNKKRIYEFIKELRKIEK